MALRKTPKSKPMTEEHDVLVENEFTAGDEHEASAAIEPIVEDAAEPVAPSLEQPIEAAVEAIPAQAVHVNEALAEETAKEAEASAWRAVEAAAVVALDFAAPVKAASEWRKTTAKTWNDSAVALFDLASALTKARTVLRGHRPPGALRPRALRGPRQAVERLCGAGAAHGQGRRRRGLPLLEIGLKTAPAALLDRRGDQIAQGGRRLQHDAEPLAEGRPRLMRQPSLQSERSFLAHPCPL